MSLFQDTSVEDHLFPKPKEPSVSNEASEDNLSAQAAILSDMDTKNLYDQLKAQPKQEAELNSKWNIDQAREQDQQMMKSSALEVVSDPSYPEETRLGIAKTLDTLPASQKNSLDLTVEKLYGLDNGVGDKVEPTYVDMAEVLGNVSEELSLQQQYFNSDEFNNEYTVESLGDFLQYMIPADESVQFSQIVADLQGGDVGAVAKAFALLGDSKMDMKERFQSLPSEARIPAMQALARVVNDTRGIVFTNDNDFAQKDLFMTIVDGDYYGEFDQFLDNAISVLDAVGLGGIARNAIRPIKARKMAVRSARSRVQPTSPAGVANEVNPKEARNLNIMAVADETGETAQATHKASREDVVMDSEAPQPRVEDGSVKSVVHTPREDLDQYMKETLVEYSPEEVVSSQLAQAKNFNEVGVIERRAMNSTFVKNENGSTTISNTYGPKDGGWNNPRQALEETLQSFRYYDLDESNLTLLQKSGTDYVPVNLKEVEAKLALREQLVKAKKKLPEDLKKINLQNDFLVKADFTREFDPKLVRHEGQSVALNFFDRVPFLSAKKKGGSSLTRHLVDPASMFDRQFIISANYAVDRSAGIETKLISLADNFAKPARELDSSQLDKISSILHDQNLLGKRFSREILAGKGITNEKELKILDDWAKYWDTVFELENRDFIKSARNAGYGLFTDKAGSNLAARPIKQRASVKPGVQAYDSALDEVITLNKNDLDNLYENGGNVAELKGAINVNDIDVGVVINRNNSDEFVREIKNEDRLLNYREGYYTVRYKDPYFVQKVDANGTKSVKTASGIKEANRIVDDLNQAAEEGVSYKFIESRELNVNDLDDNVWQIATERGRTAQRVRGERLGSDLGDDLGAIQDPVESLLASARSISRRTSMRDWLEKQKLRFIDEFGEYLPSGEYGQKSYPGSLDELVIESGTQHAKRLADARSKWEYINSLEYGYRSTVSDLWKASLNILAETIGLKSARGERAIRTLGEEVPDPAGFMRGRAFDLYLATNPLRQFIVQGHQATLLTSTYTEYVMSQKLAKEMSAVYGAAVYGDKLKDAKKLIKFTGMSADEMQALLKEYKATGFDATIDRNNLVEGAIDELIDTDNFSGLKRAHKAVTVPLRKVGFDAGEKVNLMSSWLAHRNKAIKEGKDITNAKVQAEIMGEARNFTLNMNAAGEMPYNKNSLSLIFQFMQVPHKMLTTVTTNKVLTGKEKARLLAYNLVMLPLPAGFVYSMLGEEGLPEDPLTRDLVLNGIEGAMLNKAFSLMAGDTVNIDFSSFSALDPTGQHELIMSLFEADIVEILSNSPSLSLVMGRNPRLGATIEELTRLMTEPSGEQLVVGINTALSMSSGFANFSESFKELYLQEVDTRLRNGNITDDSVNTVEKAARMFGLGTLDELTNRVVKKDLYEKKKEAMDDAKLWYTDLKKHLARKGINARDHAYAQELMNEPEMLAFRSYHMVGFSQGQKDFVLKLMRQDAEKGDTQMLDLLVRASGWISREDFYKAANSTGNSVYADTIRTIDSFKPLGEDE